MGRYARDFVVLALGCLALTWGWARGPQEREAEEGKAAIFDDETVVKAGSSVERVAQSVDVAPTVVRWARAERGPDDSSSRTLVGGLITLTTVAFQGAAPVSVGGSGTSGPVGCSAGATTTGAANACSTSTPGASSSGSCSTGTTTTTATTCSANVPPTGPNGGNNTTCSALAGSNGYCSAGAGAAAGGSQSTSCSTGGGQSNAPGGGADPSAGAVGCSAANYFQGVPYAPSNNNSCSTNGAVAGATCSTYAGNHQSCSVGGTPSGSTASCSASGNDATSNCSVQAPATGGNGTPPTQYGNQCTAITFGNGDTMGGNANCSVSAGSTGSCSVSASNTGNNPKGGSNNAQCSTFPPPSGGNTTTAQCSAFNAAGNVVAGNCSVITTGPGGKITVTGPTTTNVPLDPQPIDPATGKPVQPPATQPVSSCGSGYVGHPE